MKMGAKHILIDKEFETADLIKKLDEGISFESLALDFSNCPSKKQGGDLGTFGKGMMVKPFEKAVMELKVGEISPPVQTQFGYHLIMRTV